MVVALQQRSASVRALVRTLARARVCSCAETCAHTLACKQKSPSDASRMREGSGLELQKNVNHARAFMSQMVGFLRQLGENGTMNG